MARIEVRPTGEANEAIEFEGEDLSIQKATISATDAAGRWSGRPAHHDFNITRTRSLGHGEHWLFRVAVSSLSWSNQKAPQPTVQFRLDQAADVGVDEEVMTIQAKGLIVSSWSMSWSRNQHTIIETLGLRAWEITSMQSSLHATTVRSALADLDNS